MYSGNDESNHLSVNDNSGPLPGNNTGSRQSIDVVRSVPDKIKEPLPTISSLKPKTNKPSSSLFPILITLVILVIFMELLYLAYLKSKQ